MESRNFFQQGREKQSLKSRDHAMSCNTNENLAQKAPVFKKKASPTWLQEHKIRKQYIELTLNDAKNLKLCYPRNLILSNPNLELVMNTNASS